MSPHVREAEEACSLTGKVQVYEFRTGLDSVSSWYEAVAVPLADLLRQPGGARDRQLWLGERFTVIDRQAGHAKCHPERAAPVLGPGDHDLRAG